MLEINENYISKAINEISGKDFPELVNGLRIETCLRDAEK